jgi:hypothetical protein
MASITKYFWMLLVAATLWFALPNATASAQCPMCKNNVAAARRDGSRSVGEGLNNGIMYLLFTPYILAGVIGIIWYRNYRRKSEENA